MDYHYRPERIRKYYEQLYTNKLNNLDETDKLFEK